jgi:NADH-quinone oxidoreductase subunit L
MLKFLGLIAVLAPLAGAIVAGLWGRAIGRAWSHRVTILGVFISFVVSLFVFRQVLTGDGWTGPIYTWITMGDLALQIGFQLDRLTALMMVVVTFVSLMVHVYTIGYMAEDPGYQRFFSYISLFTFSMLMLVMANNFLQLFFGWEAVGLVSYLLIGFWYTRPTAIYANLKAFLVNRVGDFGFLLGIALILATYGSLDYGIVFSKADTTDITLICILLFVGAMGKSAQFPLHVWLPDSMEGPTPISALIHAATMVTAGIFMVARMSPLFELSETARSMVLIVGAITCFFMALIAVVNYDIKRVVAYSTLSQLGYMTMALGASAYSVAIFHLMTHAFFKAVLFLGAGSVIIALHHEQDMRKMGGLRKYMPWTYWTVLIGAIANAGIPPFSGFFSKDSIVEALAISQTPLAGVAYAAALGAIFVGGLYSFRLVFFAFHGKERFDAHHPPHESPKVVTVPLVLLAIPSVAIGALTIGPMLYGGWFDDSIAKTETMAEMAREFHGALAMVLHSLMSVPLWLAVAGAATAWFFFIKRPELAAVARGKFGVLVTILERKYGFDDFNDWFFAGGARRVGTGLWLWGDRTIIDGIMVNGTAHLIGWFAGIARRMQTGYIYTYAFTMILGVFALLSYFLIYLGRA